VQRPHSHRMHAMAVLHLSRPQPCASSALRTLFSKVLKIDQPEIVCLALSWIGRQGRFSGVVCTSYYEYCTVWHAAAVLTKTLTARVIFCAFALPALVSFDSLRGPRRSLTTRQCRVRGPPRSIQAGRTTVSLTRWQGLACLPKVRRS
jgi:hypothetical protein